MVYVKLIVSALIWGGTFIAGRIVAQELPPFSISFLRFALAGCCLYVLVRMHEGGLPQLTRKSFPGMLLLGLSGVFAYNAFFFLGLQTVPAGRAAAIIALNPVCIALFAALLLGEPLSRTRLAGIGLSVFGAIIVISRADPLALFTHALSAGDLAIFGCVASWVTYSLAGRKVMVHATPLASVAWSCIIGAGLLLPFAVSEGLINSFTTISLTAWLSIAYLGVFGTVVAFTWFYQGVKQIGASRAGVFINFVPVSAIILAAVLLNEPIPSSLLGGALVVATGVIMTNRA
ncbi:DMT family transporter [Oleidesulfovibrio sp.]|uniref:DMT family transporter n=1 Tax=Oleidesulfovibrio sp. TaxID=2909707 RepID=UPI003A8402FB